MATHKANVLSTYKTKITTFGGYTSITYHSTEIVKFNADIIILNFGGYDTVTTRRKMNQASKMFDLGYSVMRIKGETYINYCDKKMKCNGLAGYIAADDRDLIIKSNLVYSNT